MPATYRTITFQTNYGPFSLTEGCDDCCEGAESECCGIPGVQIPFDLFGTFGDLIEYPNVPLTYRPDLFSPAGTPPWTGEFTYEGEDLTVLFYCVPASEGPPSLPATWAFLIFCNSDEIAFLEDFLEAFGSEEGVPGPPEYDAQWDYNEDGFVDQSDLFIFIGNQVERSFGSGLGTPTGNNCNPIELTLSKTMGGSNTCWGETGDFYMIVTETPT